MATWLPFAASTAVETAVKGGAMTISQCRDSHTSGRKAAKKARVSPSVLYIFQFPAITRRRLMGALLRTHGTGAGGSRFRGIPTHCAGIPGKDNGKER